MELGQLLAANLQELRRERNLSLGELSKLTGISKPVLSEMEKGCGNPTISTLWKIARGFQVPYTRLLEEVEPLGRVVHRSDVLEQSEEAEHYRTYFYYNVTPERNFELIIGEVDGHSEHPSAGHGPRTEEFIYLQEGELTLRTAAQSYSLKPGDALHFDSAQSHTYVNPGSAAAKFVCINVYPQSSKKDQV